LATQLSGRLAALENAIESGLEDSAVEGRYAEIKANLRSLTGQFQLLKDSKDASYNKLVKLKETIELENKLFKKTANPLAKKFLG
jgi:hypothetical protein